MTSLAFLLGRAVARFLRGRKPRKPETGENRNGALPAFVFSGCARERTAEPSTAAYSNDATIGDLIEILENGVERPKPKKRGERKIVSSLISTK